MIINDLIDHYNHMLALGQTQPYGWSVDNVPYALVIDNNGLVQHVVQLGDPNAKKPRNDIAAPIAPTRSSNTKPRFGCDTGEYMTADPHKKGENKGLERYHALGELWHAVLDNTDTPMAHAMLAYVDRDPQWERIQHIVDDEDTWVAIAAYTMTLMIDGQLAIAEPSIKQAWSNYAAIQADNAIDTDSTAMQSLVSGHIINPALIHPKIKGVNSAQSSGATLISANAQSSESYGNKQNTNAPMSEREAYAYTAAINTMLKDWRHVQHLDNTTVLAWADADTPAYTDIITYDVFGNKTGNTTTDKNQPDKAATDKLSEMMWQATAALANGKPYDFDGQTLDPNQHCSILGIDPQAARLSVAFYLRDTMGAFCTNLAHHQDDMRIAGLKDGKIPSAWLIARQTINDASKTAKVAPNLQSDIMQAILNGTMYPKQLIRAVQTRIKADKDINATKAAIIKAYYSRMARLYPNSPIINQSSQHSKSGNIKEVLTVGLNTDSDYTPYVLGRMFATYERIQKAANPNIKATIKDKYFAQACTMPAKVYPIIGALIEKRMKQLMRDKPGLATNLSKQLGEIADKLPERYPKHLTLDEQGAFQLGYYQQRQADIETAMAAKAAKTANQTDKADAE